MAGSALARACILGIGMLATASPVRAAEYYEGKTISLIVGFEPGGGTDVTARIWAERLKKVIPGRPNVIVKNMPGAATMKAHNYIYEVAKPDGLEIGFNPFQLTSQLAQADGVRFKYENYAVIAALRGPGVFAFANAKALPNKRAEDLLNLAPVKYAGRNAVHSQDAYGTIAFELLLGNKFRYIGGYNNADKLMLAVRAGEMHVSVIELGRYTNDFKPNFLPNGEAVTLWQYLTKTKDGSYQKHPMYDGMPSFEEVHQRIKGTPPSGPLWDAYSYLRELGSAASFMVLGPPKLDKRAVAALREGFEKTAQMPDINEAMLKISGQIYDYVPPDEVERVLAKLAAIDPATQKFWKERLNKQN